MKIQNLRGTKDIFGEDALLWERIEDVARTVFKRYNFTPIRTPIIEDKALFCRSVGETSDIVQKEMYQIQSRNDSESEVDIVLRPEGTASVVRAVVQNNLLKESPTAKVYYYGPMFRAERPQKGRYRQFSQIGVEFFGNATVYADAEVIEMLVRFYEEIGVSGFVLQINDLGSAEDRVRYAEALKSYLSRFSQKLCTDCNARLQKNVMRVLDCKVHSCQPVLDEAPKIITFVSSESRQRYETLKDLLRGSGIPFVENYRIVRGLDYYNDAVFELTHLGLGSQNALAAGGRYDLLAKNLYDTEIPAVGFALGVDRLADLLKEGNNSFGSGKKDVKLAVISMDDSTKATAFKYASKIRRSGYCVVLDLSRSYKSQLRQANKEGVRWAILLGGNEISTNSLTIKDMSESAPESLKQRTIPENNFFDQMQEIFR